VNVDPSAIDDFREPWNCQHCGALIYNLDRGYPAPGAPSPKFFNHDWQKVCTLCFQLGMAVRESTYFKAAHDLWIERRNRVRNPNP